MSVDISSALLARLRAEAAASRDEICGLLFGPPGAIEQAQSCRNVAADPRRRFEIDPAALIAAHRAARDGGPAILGCYHSHPSGSALPSRQDAEDAGPNCWLWLIVGSEEAKVFRAVKGGAIFNRFDPLLLVIPAKAGIPLSPPPEEAGSPLPRG